MATPVSVEPLRVLHVERSDERSRVLMRALAMAGHRLLGQSRTVRALHDEVQRLHPDIVIVDTESPSAEMFFHVGVMSERIPLPVILFTDDDDPAKIRDAVRCGVTSYVVDGFGLERIEPIVRVAMARFERDQAVQSERDDARAKLTERKLIERAKGILMRKRGMGEEEAYHALRRIAMDRNLRMSAVAERLISMSDLLS